MDDTENIPWPAEDKMNQLTPITTTVDIEAYATLDEDTGKCYECADSVCAVVQDDMLRAGRPRMPLNTKPTLVDRNDAPVVTTGHVAQGKIMKQCGREGTVFIYENTVIKTVPMTPNEHEERKRVWTAASKHGVGPEIADQAHIRFGESD